MNLIATIMGWVMYLIYQIIPNYGICIILFTIIIKLLTLPPTYKMQVNQARMGLISSKVEKIKKSFANNPQRMQEETNKLYTEEGINQTAGCLGSLLTMVLLLGVYSVVMSPLTYILRISKDEILQAKDLLSKWLETQNITERYLSSRPELILLKYVKTNPEIFSSMNGFTEKLSSFKNNFLGFDLAGVPSFHPENGWGFTAVMLILLPVMATVVQLLMTIITQRHSRKVNPAAASAQQMGGMNLMLYLSPLMTLWIGLKVPAGMSFYWLMSSLISLGIQLCLYKYLSGDRLLAINEREKQKQIAKGPTWMQRMMEQSQQMAEQNGVRSDANRTSSADGDDGMTRKERAEYEKTLIEAARKRAALKYGDAEPEENADRK